MRHQVELDKAFLERLRTSPRKAIAELVWNAVDADADVVSVELDHQEMTGVERVRVIDNGHGITEADAEGFKRLGGSWKATAQASRGRGRALHGREGRGRFFAAALAGHARWETVTPGDDGAPRLTVIDVYNTALTEVEIQDHQPTDRPLGTTVILDGFAEPPRGIEGEEAADRITAEFAIYLTKYAVELTYDGVAIDPSVLQGETATYPVGWAGGEGELDVVEWRKPMQRRLYLCDSGGTALSELQPGVQALGFDFTAYLRWDGFAEDAALDLAELSVGPTADAIEAARATLREHFRRRAEEQTRAVIEGWKKDEVYPYTEAPTTNVEQTSRELFDVVAFTAREAIAGDKQTRRFSLRLLREALERDPGALRRVISEVLELDEAKLDDLSQLLDRTTLAAVVAVARSITDRLDFLRALEELVFEPTVRGRTLERSQLHRMLATETWVFGEEYHLVADDESLTNVLRRHLRYLDRDELAAEPVTDEEGRTRIVDLMLAKSLEQSQNRREHLVIELKAPSVNLGHKELDQIRDYANAVASDTQFDKAATHWDFLVVSTDMKETVRRQANQRNRPPGLLDDYDELNVRIWAKTWGQIIQDSRHRLKFVQAQLEYTSGRDEAIQYLHERHRAYVPEPLRLAHPQGPSEAAADE